MRILIRDLAPDTLYNYQLRSVSSDEKSEWSQLFTLQTVKKSAFPGNVTGLNFVSVGRTFSATWNPVTTNSDGSTMNDFKDYQVTIYPTATPATKVVYYTTEPRFDLSYEANVAAFGTPKGALTIEVVARDSWKNISITVATMSATNPVPATPTGLAGTALYDAIELKWNANTEDDLLGYEVYYNSTNTGTGTLVYSGPANAYTHLTVSSTPHYFYVLAFDVFSGRSLPSAYIGPITPKSSITVDATAPTAISGVTATNTPTTDGPAITVTWNRNTADSDFDSYTIRYSTSSTGPYEYMQIPQPASGTTVSAIIKGLVPGASYYISVQGADFTANKNGFTNATPFPQTASGNTNAPAAPTGIASFEGFNALTVYWIENTEADVKWGAGTYEVQIATDSGFTLGLKTLIVAAPAANFTGLTSNATYYIRVRARNSSGTFGPYATGTPNAIGQPADDIPTGTLPADTLKANSAILYTLFLNNDPANGKIGSIQTTDYSANTSGFKLSGNGLDIQSGTIAARALQIQDSANIMPTAYADFEFRTDYYTGKLAGTATGATITSTNAKFNTQALQFVANGTLYLGLTTTTYNIVLDQPATYIVSYYAAASVGAATITPTLTTNAGNVLSGAAAGLTTTMTRYSFVASVPASSTSAGVLWFNATGGGTVQIDGVQIEKQIGALTTPSQFKPPSFTSVDGGVIRTGEIRSNANSSTGDTTQPAWSINTQGGAQLNDVLVRGKIIVGASGNTFNSSIAIASYNYGASGAQWSIRGDGTFDIKTGTGAGVTLAGTGLTGNDGTANTYLAGRPAGETFYLSNLGTLMLSGTFSGSNIFGSVFATTSDTATNAVRIGPSESINGIASQPAITFGLANSGYRPFIQYDSTAQDLTIGNLSSTYYTQLNISKSGGFVFSGYDTDTYDAIRQYMKVTARGINFRGAFETGTQTSTFYYRTGNSFAWYLNGGYSPNFQDPGTGGTRLMKLDNAGNLTVMGTITYTGAAGGTGGGIRPDNEYVNTTVDPQTILGIKSFSGTLRVTGLPLDLSGISGTTVASGGTVGDKIALWNSGTGGYGIGVQASAFVNYIPTSASFVVRVASGTGNASSGATTLFSVTGAGAVNTAGTLSENGSRVYNANYPQPISYPVTSVSGTGSGISVTPTTGAVVVSNTGVTSLVAGTAISISGGTGAVTVNNIGVTSNVAGTGIGVSSATGASTISNTGVLTVTASGNMASSGGQNPAITISTTPTFTSATIPTLSGNMTHTGNVTIQPATAGPAILALLDTTAAQATPNKYLRSVGGEARFYNSANTTVIWSLTDAGNVNVLGTLSENGTRVYGPNNANLSSATPVTIAATGTSGAGTAYSRDTHTHAGVTSVAVGTGISTSASQGAITLTNTGVTAFTSNTGLSANVSAIGAVTVTNTGVLSNIAGAGITVSGATGNVTISNAGVTNLSLGATTANLSISAATGAIQLSMSPTPTFTSMIVNGASTLSGGATVKGTLDVQTTGSSSTFTFNTASTNADGFVGILTAPQGSITGSALAIGSVAYNRLSGAAQASIQAFPNGDSQFSMLRWVTATGSSTDANGQQRDGLTILNGATRVVDSTAYAGNAITNAGVVTNNLQAVGGPGYIGLQPGQYVATYYVRVSSISSTATVLSLQVTGTAITGNPIVAVAPSNLATSFIGVAVPFTITAATNSVNTTITSNQLTGTTQWWFSHVNVAQDTGLVTVATAPYFFANASITTAQIKTITASQITTGSISADEIQVTSAGKLFAGSSSTAASRLDFMTSGIRAYGGDIANPTVSISTDGTFQLRTTAVTSTSRVVIGSSTGIQIYNGSTSVFNADLAGNLSLTGIVTATGGSFTGDVAVTTSTGSLLMGAGSRTGQRLMASSTGIKGYLSTSISDVTGQSLNIATDGSMWIGSSTTFAVTSAGALTATSANISGSVTVTGSFSSGTSPNWFATDSVGNHWSGTATFPASASVAKFAVSNTGTLWATTGVVGGWTLSASTLTGTNISLSNAGIINVGSGNASVNIQQGVGLWAGNATFGSAAFRVDTSGALTANGANITGTITATTGQIGGFTISGNILTGNSSALIQGGSFQNASSGARVSISNITTPTYGIGAVSLYSGSVNETKPGYLYAFNGADSTLTVGLEGPRINGSASYPAGISFEQTTSTRTIYLSNAESIQLRASVGVDVGTPSVNTIFNNYGKIISSRNTSGWSFEGTTAAMGAVSGSWRGIKLNSFTNTNSDFGYMVFQDNSGNVSGGGDGGLPNGEASRFTIGTMNDSGIGSAVSDELWIQGSARLVFNAGRHDTEMDAIVGGNGDHGAGVAFQWRVNNVGKVEFSDAGNIYTVGSVTTEQRGQFRSTNTGLGYDTAVLEARVPGPANTGVRPRLGLHWEGIVASQLALDNDGWFILLNNPGNARESLRVSQLNTSGTVQIDGNLNVVGTIFSYSNWTTTGQFTARTAVSVTNSVDGATSTILAASGGTGQYSSDSATGDTVLRSQNGILRLGSNSSGTAATLVINSTASPNTAVFKGGSRLFLGGTTIMADVDSYSSVINTNHLSGGHTRIGTGTYIYLMNYAGGTYVNVFGGPYTNAASNERLKENIKDLPSGALNSVKNLRHVSYTLKKNGVHQARGFISENLYEHAPEVTVSSTLQTGEEVMGYNHDAMISLGMQATAELSQIVESLKEEIDLLKAQLAKK